MTPAGTADTLCWAVLEVPARPEHARTARNLVVATLGDGHPCAADAVLLASELVTNSVLHSDSRRPGGTVTITIWGDTSSVLVEVTDPGGEMVPTVHDGSDAEDGRGLFLVEQLSARWGHWADKEGGRVTWFEVQAGERRVPRRLRSGCQSGDHDVVDVGAGKAVGAGVVLEGGGRPVLGLDGREPGQARALHELECRVVR